MDSPDRWLGLEVPAPRGEDAGARRRVLVEALVAVGGTGIEEREGVLRTYVTPPGDVRGFLDGLRQRLSDALGRPPELTWRWHEDRDWLRAWRRGLGPRGVGERLVVAPSWTDPDAGPDDVVVRVDPGMAFGSGEHGTTRGALRLLERAVAPGHRVLDVGTGSGVLAVAAALLGARRVVALDWDGEAVRTAAGNVELNGVAGRVDVHHLEAAAATLRLLAPPAFDLVAANILASVLVPLVEPLRAVATDEGGLILGGILEEESDEVVGAARAAGWTLAERDVDDDWWTGLFRAGPG